MSFQKTSIIGYLHSVSEVYPVGSNGYIKRDMYVEIPTDNPMYPNHLKFLLNGSSTNPNFDKTKIVDGIAIGQQIEVHFRPKGRFWEKEDSKVLDENGKPSVIKGHIQELECWQIQIIQKTSSVVPSSAGVPSDTVNHQLAQKQQPTETIPVPEGLQVQKEGEEDLPF